MPQHFTFYELIKTKARGKSGPLFEFGVVEDIRIVNDASKEKQDSHAGRWTPVATLSAPSPASPSLTPAAFALTLHTLRVLSREQARWWRGTGTTATSTSSRPTAGR